MDVDVQAVLVPQHPLPPLLLPGQEVGLHARRRGAPGIPDFGPPKVILVGDRPGKPELAQRRQRVWQPQELRVPAAGARDVSETMNWALNERRKLRE